MERTWIEGFRQQEGGKGWRKGSRTTPLPEQGTRGCLPGGSRYRKESALTRDQVRMKKGVQVMQVIRVLTGRGKGGALRMNHHLPKQKTKGCHLGGSRRESPPKRLKTVVQGMQVMRGVTGRGKEGTLRMNHHLPKQKTKGCHLGGSRRESALKRLKTVVQEMRVMTVPTGRGKVGTLRMNHVIECLQMSSWGLIQHLRM